MCKIPELPLKELDPHCREFVYFLNKYGFTTQYCCEGHMDDPYNKKFCIIFKETVTDKMIDQLLFILGRRGEFTKWKRLVFEHGQPRILTNWMYTIDYGTAEENHIYANIVCRIFKKYFNEKYTKIKYHLIV